MTLGGQLEYEQFVCAQSVLAVCEGNPCLYTFILSDECLMPPYLQQRGRGCLSYMMNIHTNTLMSVIKVAQYAIVTFN